jgi:glycosyltransferase involved in cell wall biosynthesis
MGKNLQKCYCIRMTQKPKISLIIIAFNEEKYIGDCLEHAIKNGGEKFHEIIVVDNASTDCTSQIASAFPHVKVIYEKEKGITKARQRGLKEAQGEILAFIDADARIPKGWYEIIEKEFSRVDEKGKEKIAGLSGPYIYHDIPKSQQNMIREYWWLAMPLYLLIG